MRLTTDDCYRIRQLHQRSLGKRDIEKRSSRGKCRPKPDSFSEKKWRHCPQLVQRQYDREHPLKFLSQPLVIEGHRRDQITAQRNTHARCHQHGDEDERAPPIPAKTCP